MNGKKARLQSIVEYEEDEEEARPLQRGGRMERRDRRYKGLARFVPKNRKREREERDERDEVEEVEEDSVIVISELVCLGICIVLLVLKYAL